MALFGHLISSRLPSRCGRFTIDAFESGREEQPHLAIWNSGVRNAVVNVRIHSECITGDVFGSTRCDCGEQLSASSKFINENGGVLIYLRQEGRGIGLSNKLKAYKLQEQGMDTIEANIELGFKADERDYGVGAQMLRELGISKMRLMSNNPKKRTGLIGYGLEIVENVALEVPGNAHNHAYLKTKRDRMGHDLHLDNNA